MIRLWAPVAVYMAATFYLATMPSVPGSLEVWFSFSDTVIHAVGYFALGLLTLRAVAGGRWSGVTGRALLVAWGIAVIHGAAVEVVQMYVPTRMAEWRDLANDAIGAGFALGLAGAWGIMRSTSRAE